MHALGQQLRLRQSESGADRQASAQSLGHGDHVRQYAGFVLEAEPLAGTAHAGLYLVDNHEDPVLVT